MNELFDDVIDEGAGRSATQIDWDNVAPSDDSSFLDFPDAPDLDPSLDADLGQQPPELLAMGGGRRKAGAAAYEKKVADGLRAAVVLTAPNPATVADAAALILHGGNVSRAIGDLAAEDARVAAMVDFIGPGVANPYLSALAATAPLLIQLVRNHEEALEPKVRVGLRIPFTKRAIPFPRIKMGIKLPGLLKNSSNNPDELYQAVFNEPKVIKQLKDKGIHVAPGRHRAQ